MPSVKKSAKKRPLKRAPEPFEALEPSLLADGSRRLIAGVDEAGRGPLAGPVSIGLVIFAPEILHKLPEIPASLQGLTDSKLLSEKRREDLYAPVRELSLYATVVQIDSRRIDRDGINPSLARAIDYALERARRAGFYPDMVCYDGHYIFPELKCSHPNLEIECYTKGDSRIFSIAAASILAKVGRDRRMPRYDRLFPGYDFARHKGYGGSSAHHEAIKKLGLSPIHRRSYCGRYRKNEEQLPLF